MDTSTTTQSSLVRLISPAKVNLFLGVGKLKESGYHEVFNIMHAIALHDVLTLRIEELSNKTKAFYSNIKNDGQQADYDSLRIEDLVTDITIESHPRLHLPDIPKEDNLVYKVLVLFARNLIAYEQEQGEQSTHRSLYLKPLSVHIDKQIPVQAGLGGGSSNAAAALIGAAHLWGIDRNHPALLKAAESVGSDVAFFLFDSCASFDGKGEHFVKQYTPRNDTLVLIKPFAGCGTGAVYRRFDELGEYIDENLYEQARNTNNASDVPLENGLTNAAIDVLPEISRVMEWAAKQQGVKDVMLCGSGSTCFAIMENARDAQEMEDKAQRQGWNAFASSFVDYCAKMEQSPSQE